MLIVTVTGTVLMLVLIVLTAKLLCLVEENCPHPVSLDTTAGGHPGQQKLMAESGIFWAEGVGKRVGNKLVFTFTSSRCGRKGPRDRLLARLRGAWPRAAMLLVCGRHEGAVAGLRRDGPSLRNGRLNSGHAAVALEPRLHLTNPPL